MRESAGGLSMGIVIADDQERERVWLRDLLSRHLPT